MAFARLINIHHHLNKVQFYCWWPLAKYHFGHVFLAVRSSFHADLLGGDSLSCGSSEDSRVESSDVMSVHSDTTLAATRERLSLAEYALMDEDALSDYSDVRFSRQSSAFSEANHSLQYSQSSGISRSLETVNTTSTDIGSRRYHKRLKKVDHPILRRSNPVTFAKGEKVTNSYYLEVPPRTTGSRKKLSGKNTLWRSKSDGASGRSTSIEDDKLHQKRSPSNFRLEIKTFKGGLCHSQCSMVIFNGSPNEFC